MKATGMIVIGLLSAMEVVTASGAGRPAVDVCVDGEFDRYDHNIASQAQMRASGIFRRIGVQLEWHRASSGFCGNSGHSVIRVTYCPHTPADVGPAALAYARPYEGIHIDVLCDRIQGAAGAERFEVLGYVLVHEITHILQGVVRHSDSGIMKAQWDKADFVRMRLIPMAFAEGDVDLIHRGLRARADVAAPNTFLAVAGTGNTATGSSNIEGSLRQR